MGFNRTCPQVIHIFGVVIHISGKVINVLGVLGGKMWITFFGVSGRLKYEGPALRRDGGDGEHST